MTAPILVTYNGMTKSLNEWAKYTGHNSSTFYNRYVRSGGDMEYCLNAKLKTPIRLKYKGKMYSLTQLAKMNGSITEASAYTRYMNGWTADKIVEVPNRRLLKKKGRSRKPPLCTDPECDSCPYPDCKYY